MEDSSRWSGVCCRTRSARAAGSYVRERYQREERSDEWQSEEDGEELK